MNRKFSSNLETKYRKRYFRAEFDNKLLKVFAKETLLFLLRKLKILVITSCCSTKIYVKLLLRRQILIHNIFSSASKSIFPIPLKRPESTETSNTLHNTAGPSDSLLQFSILFTEAEHSNLLEGHEKCNF